MTPRWKFLALLLLLAGLALGTHLLTRFSFRLDWTSGRSYSLSDGTKKLLSAIQEPVTLRLYYTPGAQAPVALKNYATRVEEMLRAYADAAPAGKLRLEILDPKPDSPAEEQAVHVGLQRQALPDGSVLVLGLVAFQTGEHAIPYLDPEREPFLEYDISRAIHRVQRLEKPKLALLSSLPFRGADSTFHGNLREKKQALAEEWEHLFDIVELFHDSLDIPGHPAAVVLLHPQPLSAPLQWEIDQYLLAGGTVIIALDPSSRYFRSRRGEMLPVTPALSSDLPKLLRHWGVAYDPLKVVSDTALATPVSTAEGNALLPTWLSTNPTHTAKLPPFSSAQNLLFPEAGAFTVAPAPGREITPLITVTETAGFLPAAALGFDAPDETVQLPAPDPAARHLAVMIRGAFATAFPEGMPAEVAMFTDHPPVLKTSQTPGTLVLLGDSDWLMDAFSVRRKEGDASALDLLNDNLPTAASLLEYATGSPELVSIREKRPTLRTFAVVRALERAAQARHQSKLRELETRLEEVQKRLDTLSSGHDDDTKLIPTAEMQIEIDTFRAEEKRIEAERRDIRRALRADIETLETRVLLFNLVLVPALIVAAGAWFIARRSRSRTRPTTATPNPKLQTPNPKLPSPVRRLALILAALVLAVAATHLLTRDRRASAAPDPRVGQSLVPLAVLEQTRTLRLIREGRTATLAALPDGTWTVREFHGFDASRNRLAAFFRALQSIHINRLVTTDPAKIAKFGFTGDRMEFLAADGSPLLTLDVGLADERQDHFMRFNGEDKVYHAPLYGWLDSYPRNWIHNPFFAFKKDSIQAIEIPFDDGAPPLRLRLDPAGNWTTDDLPPGATLVTDQVKMLADALTELRFRDVQPLDAPDAVAARAHARRLSFQLADGTRYTIAYGRGPTPPATANAAPDAPPPAPPPAFIHIESSRADDPLNTRMAAWAHEVRDAVLEDLPTARATYLAPAP